MPFPHRRRPRRAVAAAALGIAAALPACSQTTGGSPAATTAHSPSGAPSAGGRIRITAKDFTFVPAVLTVRPGVKITVTDKDSATHTLTATGDKLFDTGDIEPGTSATFTAPAKAGSYPYFCTIHPYMKGRLVVRG
ncbi:cupredoxin domain-containing protein [Streptomyces sp. NPDC053427]|uniref:cupredoxin domain-containing protein n=1 Tax=Streptomyces sp. NPDC053427 TaxID=3365701 RepID=UPI0037CFF66B